MKSLLATLVYVVLVGLFTVSSVILGLAIIFGSIALVAAIFAGVTYFASWIAGWGWEFLNLWGIWIVAITVFTLLNRLFNR